MNASADRSAQRTYDYANPVDLEQVASEPLFAELVASAAFRRLLDVRFLGGIDYLLRPSPNGSKTNIRYTRYQHSLGVARLAALYADTIDLPDHHRRLAYSAALLHDIGHAPLSHSLEPFFEEKFGINHHIATRNIVTGKIESGHEIYEILRRHHIEPSELLAVIEGEIDPFHGFFGGPINFDTIEGILRSRRYVKPDLATPSPTDVVIAAIRRQTDADRQIVDSFWVYKDEIYKCVIKSRIGILADYLCQYVVKNSPGKLLESDFFSTERTLFRKVPELRSILLTSKLVSVDYTAISKSIPYIDRHFYVNTHASFFNRDDKGRYRQNKKDRIMLTKIAQPISAKHEEWDLFHESRLR